MRSFLMFQILTFPLYFWLTMIAFCVGLIAVAYIDNHQRWNPIWVVLYPNGSKSQQMPKMHAVRIAAQLNCLIMRVTP